MRNHFLEKTTSHGIAVSDRISLDTMSLQSFYVSVILRRGRTAAQLCLGLGYRREDQTFHMQIRQHHNRATNTAPTQAVWLKSEPASGAAPRAHCWLAVSVSATRYFVWKWSIRQFRATS